MSASPEVYSIDANVILRYLRKDHQTLFPKAYEIMKGVETGKIIVTCDPVNLGEVVWVLKSAYKLSNEQIVDGLEPILQANGFRMPNKERYLFALRLFATRIRHFGDACACAAALQDCDGRLYSFDAELSNVEGIARSDQLG